MTKRTPVVIAGNNCLSGVTTWADQLRAILADDPRYDVRSLYIGAEQSDGSDLRASSIDEAHELVRSMAPVVVVPNYFWALYLVGFEPGVVCIGMCHADSDEQYYHPLSWYEPVIARFIAVSRECAERLTERLPYRANDIATLPYGVSIPRPLNRNYQARPLRLIYAGRVTQLQKRIWDFIPLLKLLLQQNVEFVFDIIGGGDAYSAMKDEVNDLFPAGLVRFHSRVPHNEMPGQWLTHDVFLQVSEFEGTSVSMLEAMAHGAVPVVTAATSGIEGVIHHGQNGFVVPIGDMVAMAQVLASLAADPSRLAVAGQAAYQSVQSYAMELYGERFAEFLDQVPPENHRIDLEKRYGMFGQVHPLFAQRQLIVHQQEQIKRLKQGAIGRMLKRYRNLVASTTQR